MAEEQDESNKIQEQEKLTEASLKSVGAEIKKFKHLSKEIRSIGDRLNEIKKKHKVAIVLWKNKDESLRLVMAIDRENSIP